MLPNPSGLNAHFTPETLGAAFGELRAAVDRAGLDRAPAPASAGAAAGDGSAGARSRAQLAAAGGSASSATYVPIGTLTTGSGPVASTYGAGESATANWVRYSSA